MKKMLRPLFHAAHVRLRKGVLVLLYHRITELRRDPWSLSVTPLQFEQQIAVLRDCTCPVRLSEMEEHLGSGWFRRPCVAVTFDDGYADNLHQAEPVLRASGVPATVFVVSGTVREQREFWWDELERVVFDSDRRDRKLELRWGEHSFTWTAPDDDEFKTDEWQAWTGAPPSRAHQVYTELYHRLSPLSPDERKAMLDDFIHQTAATRCARSTHRPLSYVELTELAGSSVIDIGVHTVTHPVLAGMPKAQQEREVIDAKAELESITGRRLHHFSYPFGKRDHYNHDTMDLVRSAGFAYAFVNEPGIATATCDPLQIPRVVAPALPGPEFQQWLAHVLGTLY